MLPGHPSHEPTLRLHELPLSDRSKRWDPITYGDRELQGVQSSFQGVLAARCYVTPRASRACFNDGAYDGQALHLPNHPHPDLGAPRWRRSPLLRARERDRPKAIGVPSPATALGVEAHLPRREDAPLDAVDLAHELAVTGERDVAPLEQDLHVGGPALLRFVREILRNHLRIVAREVLGEVHADAAPVDGEASDGDLVEQTPQIRLLLRERDLLVAPEEATHVAPSLPGLHPRLNPHPETLLPPASYFA